VSCRHTSANGPNGLDSDDPVLGNPRRQEAGVLDRHPHLQGLLLGTVLLATAVAATPLALSAVTGATDPPGITADAPDADAKVASPADPKEPAAEENADGVIVGIVTAP
jgi:hypothetical protein